MQLIFEKKNNDITVEMVTGTIPVNFSYTAMIQQLLKRNKFEDTQYKGLLDEEKKRIEEMLAKINTAVQNQEK